MAEPSPDAGPKVLREARDARGVVTLTFDRPEVRNAFDPALMRAITDVARRLADDPTCRVVVLTGAGTVFSSGADLTWMSAMVDYDLATNRADSQVFEDMLRSVHDLPVPVVARVNGHALGGASGLLGCVDVAIAVRDATFGFTEARIGIAPAMISAYVQPRIGTTNARRLFLTGERFDAERALAIGLVGEVVEAEALDAAVERLVGELLAGGPHAQRAIKPLIAAVAAAGGPDDTVEHRIELISRLRVSDEGQEGMRAFFERRPPAWAPRDAG